MADKHTELSEQEWSHFYDVDDMEKNQTKVHIEASEEECQDIARRLQISGVKSAEANLVLQRSAGSHAIEVGGEFRALLVLNCSITLEDFEQEIIEPVEGWFADKAKAVSFAAAKREREVAHANREVEILPENEDPEPIINGVIDLGELVTQHISLALPPYPKKEGAAHEFGDEAIQVDENSPLRKNPFEALKDWKEKR